MYKRQSVDSLASDYYMDDTTLDGNIVTNVTQNVTVDKDMIIKLSLIHILRRTGNIRSPRTERYL